jgi:hypothetical protein
MKKMVLIAIAVLLIGGMALAIGYGTKAMQRSQDITNCEDFVDVDGDGVNDNCPNDGTRVLTNRNAQDGTGFRHGATGEKGPRLGRGFGKAK